MLAATEIVEGANTTMNFPLAQKIIAGEKISLNVSRCRTAREPRQKASERSEAIEQASVSGKGGWGWKNPHSDCAERPKRAAMSPKRP